MSTTLPRTKRAEIEPGIDEMRTKGQVIVRLLVFAVLVACLNCPAGAQAASAVDHANSVGPEYEVATVKVNNTGSGSIRLSIRDDILQATNIQLGQLIEAGYDIRRDQILGLPHWAEVEHYDIVAKVVDMTAEQLRGLSSEQRRVMLQHLMEQRFHLRSHVETRTLSLLKLTVVKEGIKFTEWQKPSGDQQQQKGSMNVNNDEMTAVGVPIASLVRFLSSTTHMPVVDETGLTGNYNLHLKWQREEEGQASGLHDQALPSIYAALPEQLGLKLESGKGPVKVLIVDSIEQPSEN
jgi:bla regulator protein BlaR1